MLALALGLPRLTAAVEPICPGGSNPRPDIVWCADFEDDDAPACANGCEACLEANGVHAGSGPLHYCVATGDAAVGQGKIVGDGPPGGTGPGFTSSLADLPPSDAACLRFYVRFPGSAAQASWDHGDHGPAILGWGESCYVNISLNWSGIGVLFGTEATCGRGSRNLPANRNVEQLEKLKNGRWTLVEMCADLPAGRVQAWIDDVLVVDYSGLDLTGPAPDVKFRDLWLARDYVVHCPPWEGGCAREYDQFAYSAAGRHIGPAAAENPRGAADAKSPYQCVSCGEAYVGRRYAYDCSATGLTGYGIAYTWRSGFQLDGAITHAGHTDRCGGGADQALLVSLAGPGDGGGVYYGLPQNTDHFVSHGWIYLPASTDFRGAHALFGFARYGPDENVPGGSKWGRYVGLCVSDGHWAVCERNGAAAVAAWRSAEPAAFGRWVEYELQTHRAGSTTLMIDRKLLLPAGTLPTPDWLWGPGPLPNAVIGVLDLQTGTGPFVVRYDDTSVGTMSFWACDDTWSRDACPWAVTSPSPTATPLPTSTPAPTMAAPTATPTRTMAPTATPATAVLEVLPPPAEIVPGRSGEVELGVRLPAGRQVLSLEATVTVDSGLSITGARVQGAAAGCQVALNGTGAEARLAMACPEPVSASGPWLALEVALAADVTCATGLSIGVAGCTIDEGALPCTAGARGGAVARCRTVGSVTDSHGAPLGGVRVLLDGVEVAASRPDGSFELDGSGTLELRRVGAATAAISALDAALILRDLVGLEPLAALAARVADTSGNGTVSALDAALVLRFVTGRMSRFPVADLCGTDWLFVPLPGPGHTVVPEQIGAGSCSLPKAVLAAENVQVDLVGAPFGDTSLSGVAGATAGGRRPR